jgi:hypothetical protein
MLQSGLLSVTRIGQTGGLIVDAWSESHEAENTLVVFLRYKLRTKVLVQRSQPANCPVSPGQ